MGRNCSPYLAWVRDRSGKLHKLSPSQIISDLKEAIEHGKEWPIEPNELIAIISKPEFTEIKGNEIKTIILNYCADLIAGNTSPGEELPDIGVITYCYYTSYGDDAVGAKMHYKQTILDLVIDKYLSKKKLDCNDKDTSNWRKNWETAAMKNFCRFFGPELSRWENKIRKKFSYDFEKVFHVKTGN